MFFAKTRRFLKSIGAAPFLVGVTALLALTAPALGQTFANGQYCTFTQGGWGAVPRGNNPGMLLSTQFDNVYPGNVYQSGFVVVGTPLSMKFRSPEAVSNYLPAGGKPKALTANLVDPISSPSGVFGGQVLALQLNVDFSNAGIVPEGIGKLVLTGTQTSFDGKSVQDVLNSANQALGGGSVFDSTLNDLVALLNQGFDNCYPSGWAQEHLVPPSEQCPPGYTYDSTTNRCVELTAG